MAGEIVRIWMSEIAKIVFKLQLDVVNQLWLFEVPQTCVWPLMAPHDPGSQDRDILGLRMRRISHVSLV